MKRTMFLAGMIGLLILLIPCRSFADDTDLFRGWCEKWCEQNPQFCDFCSQTRGCGPSYYQHASFGGGPMEKTFYACKGGPEDKVNQTECQKWCDEHKGAPHKCFRCTPVTGCGTGYSVLTTFRGKGKNWHACAKTAYREASEDNKAECEKWCKEHEKDGCRWCSEWINCGSGMVAMEHFKGKGKNWHACKSEHEASYKEESNANKAECVKWCREHTTDGCTKCSELRYCGPGFEAMKHFEGRGKNWHACKKK